MRLNLHIVSFDGSYVVFDPSAAEDVITAGRSYAQAIDDAGLTGKIRLDFVTSGVHDVSVDDEICPEKATILGPVRVIACEFPDITCRHVDIAAHAIESATDALADRVAQTRAHVLRVTRGGTRVVTPEEALKGIREVFDLTRPRMKRSHAP